MKKVKSISFYMLVFLVSIVLSTMVAQADTGSEPGATAPAIQTGNTVEDPMVAAEPNWGTSDFSMFQIPAAAFSVKSSSTTWAYAGIGYIYRTGGGDDQFWAPLILPPGANLAGIRIFYYDNSASDISVYLTRYYGDTSPDVQNISEWTSSGTPGYNSTYISIGETIDYKDAADNEQAYVLIVRLPDASSIVQFKGVRVLYYLQVSPEPATATFSDVPTSHQYFQYIEALADSGITTGYADGTFRPGSYVTRGQMATFLSKALGLHWNGNGH